MGDSLKDQLVALGLASPEDKKRAAKKGGRKKGGGKRAGAGKGGRNRRGHPGEMSLDEAWRARQREEKQSAEEKKRRKQEEDRQRRKINLSLQQLVEKHALNDASAELKRNFLYKGRIRSVLVTPEQMKALNAGELGLVFLRGSYFVMAPEHVEAVRAISADHVPELGGDQGDESEEEFPVPDDLTW